MSMLPAKAENMPLICAVMVTTMTSVFVQQEMSMLVVIAANKLLIYAVTMLMAMMVMAVLGAVTMLMTMMVMAVLGFS